MGAVLIQISTDGLARGLPRSQLHSATVQKGSDADGHCSNKSRGVPEMLSDKLRRC